MKSHCRNLNAAAVYTALAWFGAAGTPATATEGGGSNYLPGFYGDMAMAVLPATGTFFSNFFAGYGDRMGNTGTLLEMPGVLHTTDLKLFGGGVIVGGFGAVAGALDRSSNNVKDRFGLGDFYLMPAAVHWDWGKLSLVVFEGIVAPTGRYQKGGLNAGRNIWTFDHNAMLTASLPGDNELSMDLGYMNNLRNPATHYLSGDELHFDYALGHYWTPTFGTAIAGSWYRQLTRDSGSGVPAGVPFSEAATIGPVVSYTASISGTDVTLSLKWLHEFNVKGRTASEYLIWRAFFEF